MNRFILTLGMLLTLFHFGYSASQDSINVASQESLGDIPSVSIQVNGFKYSFKNDLEELTLKPQKTGVLKVSWDSFNTSDAFIGFRYRPLNSAEWTTVSDANEDSSSITIDGINENITFFKCICRTINIF